MLGSWCWLAMVTWPRCMGQAVEVHRSSVSLYTGQPCQDTERRSWPEPMACKVGGAGGSGWSVSEGAV